MPLVDLHDLLQHAREHRYAVASFDVADLESLDDVVAAAERCRAPVVLAIDARRFERPRRARALLAAMHAAARDAAIPLALYLDGGAGDDLVIEAIRRGCNGVSLRPDRQALAAALRRDCGVAVGVVQGTSTRFGNAVAIAGDPDATDADIDAQLAGGVAMLGFGAVPGADAERVLRLCRAAGRADAAARACRPWAPVEHLIVYNVAGLDEAGIERMMAAGRERLGAIPGVLDVFTGRALAENAKYRYCWLVRFTHPAVIESYASHPDHAAFANGLFRPIAGDRITIDYQLVE